MTYKIRVVTRSGVSTITTEGQVPEGEHDIAGHGAQYGAHIEVTRRDSDGRYVTHAQHTAHSQE